jgi:methyl-accepting chemotaxis protein
MGIFRNFTGSKHDTVSIIESAELSLAKSAEAERDESTLESVTSCVMVADENNIIVKVNPAAMEMMRIAEKDIRRELPTFSVASLVGSNIDIFHKNPAHQRRMLESLSSTHKGQITVGARTFRLTANPIFNDSQTRLGTVVEWEDVSDKLSREKLALAKAEQEKVAAAANSRIKAALDCVSSNVMMADADNVIIYTNDSVMRMLRNAEADVRKELPSFNTDTILGSSVDIFHKNPAHQKSMLAALKGTHRAQIAVGGRTFSLIANPVLDAQGNRQGTVVEWTDRTEELAFEDIVDGTISSAVAGELTGRIDLAGREGFIAVVSTGINQLLDIFENVLKDAAASISELAEGRLTRKIETEYSGSYDSLKRDINQTIDKLVEVVSEISESGLSVKEGASEISSGNTNLSQRTEEQAASLEETSAAMEEITTTVQQNAANAVQANTLARGARETAENGGAVVGTAISAMQAISESSNKINDIIGVIDEIAFQTNLLALNAAVEAARAGDQGRGFAVVADEVRSLAGRSATAAKEIKELIKDSSERVKEGSDLVNKSGETLEEIVTAVKKVNDIVAEISTASDEQATGLDEINKAMGEMDEMTQQNAALVEQAAAASESLSSQAENLEALISFFDTGMQQAARPSAPVRRTSVQRAPAPATKASVRKPSPAKREQATDGKDWSEF